MKKILCTAVVILLVSKILIPIKIVREDTAGPTEHSIVETTPIMYETFPTISDQDLVRETVESTELSESIDYDMDEVLLLMAITIVESGGECEEGQRLVIDSVLNRVDSPYFPDTITDVIYQPGAYAIEYIDWHDIRDGIKQLVIEELKCRTNYDVIYFCSIDYNYYGTPLFQVGNHYFSSY